jgi:serine/threonine-protein kinase HipA
MLTIQLFNDGQWQDAAVLDIPDPKAGRLGLAALSYHPQSYALEYMGRDDQYACSLGLPVDLMQTYRGKPWFAFLDDIMPAGASRRYWVNYLGIGNLPSLEQDYQLLAKGTIAPVGNMRIKESLPIKVNESQLTQMRFSEQDVVERNADFLEYAQAMGAASGGATGAGGEAPKLLVRCSTSNEIWIDTYQEDLTNQDQHYLVKFPRGNRAAIDCKILQAEFHYYHELQALGIETINTSAMRLLEGERYPSLWLPRFDVDFIDGQQQRYGLESIYSVLGKAPGTHLNHFSVLRDLVKLLNAQYAVTEEGKKFDQQNFVIEWVKRDFLNVVFGNSDNHGRNTSLIKRPTGIFLAPVYDFAPMKVDPEGVIRNTSWGSPYEEGGRFDWIGIARALADIAEPEEIISQLKRIAIKLPGLGERLAARGVPVDLLEIPVLGFQFLNHKLKNWQLL